MTKSEYLKMVSEKRKNGNIDEAILVAQEAKDNYSSENIFEKLLGDLFFQKRQYKEAGVAYIKFLSKIGEDAQYIKHFANFLPRYLQVVSKDISKEYIQAVADSLETVAYSDAVIIQLCKILTPYITLDNITLFEDDHNFKKVTSYMQEIEKSNKVYIVYNKVLFLEHSIKNKRIDKYIVSSMEKKGQYQDALQLITNVLQYDTDSVAVRTLFRICRKLDDYTIAEEYIQEHPEIKNHESFNVLYEFVFYFSKTGNIEERNDTLKKIEKCSHNSVPIMRTLYNFYLQFGMIDKATEITSKISELEGNQSNHDRKKQEEEAALALLDVFREMFEELQHSRKLISMSELLKGFSHELGQPITNIRYSIQLYQMKMDMGINTKDELTRMLDDILSQTLRIKSLLSRFSPIVSDKDNTSEFSVTQEIKTIFEEFSSRLVKENIEWEVHTNVDFIMYGDKVRFDQVFYNLIGNSIYAIKEKGIKGKISVKISDQSEYYRITFEDNGVGIDEKYLDKIFEPFFTTKKRASNEGGGGEGLGLYIIWNIVQMFGGKIRVDKQFKSGARFIIEILKNERK